MTKQKFFRLLQALIFIAIFLFLLVHVTYMLRTDGDVKNRFVGFYGEKNNSIDAILIGSSPVYPCYAAPMLWEEYGICAYPLSTNVQRPKAAIHLVEEAEKTQSPSLYIFDVLMFLNEDEGMTANLAYTRGVTDNLKYSLNRIRTINDLVDADDAEARYTFYFDIFKYHSNWDTLILPRQWATFWYAKKDPLKGFVINDEVGPTETVDCSDVTERLAIPADEEETLYTLLDYLTDAGLNALFIVSPTSMTEEKEAQYNYMQDIVETYGYNFLNLNDYYAEIGMDFATDFYDYGTHTNALGARKCTAFLGEYLTEHYTWEDKRGQKAYASWDKAYETWSAQMAEAEETIWARIAAGDFAVIEEEE